MYYILDYIESYSLSSECHGHFKNCPSFTTLATLRKTLVFLLIIPT